MKTGARSGNNTFCVVELNHNEPSMHYIDIRSTTTFKKSLEILSVFFVFSGTYVSKNQLDASLLPWPQELNVCCSASSDVMSNVYINCDIDSHSSDVEKHYYICKFEFGLGDRCGISEKTKVLESVTFSPIISSLCLLPASKSLNDANAATNKRKDADGEIGIDTYMDSDSEKRKRTPIKKSDTDNNNSDDEQDDNDSNAGYDENNESNNLKGGDICFIYKESPGGDRMQHINKALYWNGQNVCLLDSHSIEINNGPSTYNEIVWNVRFQNTKIIPCYFKANCYHLNRQTENHEGTVLAKHLFLLKDESTVQRHICTKELYVQRQKEKAKSGLIKSQEQLQNELIQLKKEKLDRHYEEIQFCPKNCVCKSGVLENTIHKNQIAYFGQTRRAFTDMMDNPSSGKFF